LGMADKRRQKSLEGGRRCAFPPTVLGSKYQVLSNQEKNRWGGPPRPPYPWAARYGCPTTICLPKEIFHIRLQSNGDKGYPAWANAG
jgi:hypothetical protein